MAVLSNTMMQGTAAISDEDAEYNIEKSIRFNQGDSPGIVRTAKAGNRRIWTLSCWFKRGDKGRQQRIFTSGVDGNNYTFVELKSDDNLYFQVVQGNSNVCQATTNARFRDLSAWYHLVVTIDTNQPLSTNRVKIFINGKIQDYTYDTTPAQGLETETLESGSPHKFGQNAWSTDGQFNGYIADAYLIDGLALSPAAFGSFDAANNWNAKAFALPAPNDGTTWSDETTGTWSASYPKTRIFDGDPYTQAEVANDNSATFTPPTPIVAKQAIRIKSYVKTSTPNGNFDLKVNGESILAKVGAAIGNATTGWYTLETRTLTSLQIGQTSANTEWQLLYCIEVDGVLLTDDQADSTTLNNTNNGTKWSDYFIATTAFYSNSYPPTKAFDGIIGGDTQSHNGSEAAFGSYIEFKPPTTITANDHIGLWMKLKNGNSASGEYDVKINGTSILSSLIAQGHGDWQYYTITSKTIDSTNGLYIGAEDSNHWANLRGIVVDGHVLIDETVDNSFHLKFNDTTTNTALGYDSFGADFTESQTATGGPILKTNISGQTVTSGTHTDPDDSNLKLGIAGTAFSDTEGGTITASSSVIDTAQSKFYGSSIKFDGSDDYVTGPSSLWASGGDRTFEAWIYADSVSSGNGNVIFDTGGSGQLILKNVDSGNRVFWHAADGHYARTSLEVPVDEWFHLAFCQTNDTRTVFINGIKNTTYSSTYGNPQTQDWNGNGALRLGHPSNNNREYFHGWMQDIRIYDKIKYTTAFKPPTRNDFTVNNLTAVGADTGIKFDNGNTTVSGSGYAQYARISLAANSTQKRFKHKHPNSTTRYFFSDQSHSLVHTHSNQQGGNTMGYRSGSTMSAEGTFATANSVTAGVSALSITGLGDGDTTFVVDTTANKIWMSMDDGTTWLGGGDPSNTSSTATVLIPDDTALWFWSCPYTSTNETILTYVSDEDCLVDTPTSYGTDTGTGGELRGNFCTFNPLSTAGTLSQGNLKLAGNGGYDTAIGTVGANSGKWYAEFHIFGDAGGYTYAGIAEASHVLDNERVGNKANAYGCLYYSNANYASEIKNGGSSLSNVPGANLNTVFPGYAMVAMDIDAKKIWYGWNGTWFENASGVGNPATGANPMVDGHANFTDGFWTWAASPYHANNEAMILNAGQHAFKYTAPSGFKALCTQNLDDTFSGAELNNPSKYFDAITYRGNGSGDDGTSQAIKGANFQPDLVWLKARGQSWWHHMFDAVRGAGKSISPNSQNAEQTLADNQFTSFNSDGFTVVQKNNAELNEGGENYISWLWDAGTAAATASTDGSITPDAQWVNATAGFSITKYTGTQANATVGHGLNAAPDFMIHKMYDDGSTDWQAWHSALNGTQGLQLSTNGAAFTQADMWNNTAPTNTVFHLGAGTGTNKSGEPIMMYLWTGIPGFSHFGQYTGNGSMDGPFVYTGMRPKLIIIKSLDQSQNWFLFDSARIPDNSVTHFLKVNSGDAEGSAAMPNYFIFMANGFQVTNTSGAFNTDDKNYCYAAWAEHPFKTARAK